MPSCNHFGVLIKECYMRLCQYLTRMGVPIKFQKCNNLLNLSIHRGIHHEINIYVQKKNVSNNIWLYVYENQI